jgi:hypothetical protein
MGHAFGCVSILGFDVAKPCHDISLLRGWSVAGLPLAEHWGISLWAGPTSMIGEESSIQSIQTSCSTALPVNLDKPY